MNPIVTDKYTLFQGDCLSYMRSIPDKSVDAVITDPPYGMNLNTDWHGMKRWRGEAVAFDPIIGDNKRFDPTPFLPLGYVHIFWGAQYFCHSLPENGGWLVFNKRGNGKPSEICFGDCELAWRDSGQSVRLYSQMWHGVARWSSEGRLHPSQKPVGLMKWCIRRYTKPVDTIFDPFMGSGTTGVACMQLGRRFIGCEIDPGYFEIARKRIEAAASQMIMPIP
jgi:site-specific DNA-methyltransferase (adenine-specific)/modification methylase